MFNKKKKLSRSEAIVYNKPGYQGVTDAIDRLKNNILFESIDGKYKVIQIESSISGEGKSTTVANLSVALGDSEKKVLVMDLDFKKPRVHRIFNIDMENGISDYLLGNIEESKIIKKTAYKNISIITRGSEINNSTPLLTSDKLKKFIEKLKGEYDFILLDCPPVLVLSDYMHISRFSDGVLFNIAFGETKRSQVRESIEALRKNNINIIGANFTFYNKKNNNDYGDYDYYSYYGHDYGEKSSKDKE